MDILMPDPHPGRCLNFRYDTLNKITRRCLDYEGHEGSCQFAPIKARLSDGSASWQADRRPEPWVSPLERSRS